MNEELKQKLTERFEAISAKAECDNEVRDALLKAYLAGGEYGYQYARKNLWYDAQGDIVPEYGREVIVIGRDGKVFFGHRPDPKEVTMVEGKPYHAKTYDKNGWNWPDIALWLDVEIPHETVDKIATEYYKEKWTEKR